MSTSFRGKSSHNLPGMGKKNEAQGKLRHLIPHMLRRSCGDADKERRKELVHGLASPEAGSVGVRAAGGRWWDFSRRVRTQERELGGFLFPQMERTTS